MVIFILALLLLGYSILAGGLFESRLLFPSLAVAGAFFGGLLLWRGVSARARLPRLGIGLPLLLFFLVGASSLTRGFDPHVLTRLALWAAYGVVLYLFVDLFDVGIPARAVIAALILATGLLNLAALAETYQQYATWWQQTDLRGVMPPEPFRFVSLVGYSGTLMGLVNLVAPFTLVLWRGTRRVILRVGLIYWWLLYLFVILGSSSRSGLGGAAVWPVVFGGLWLVERGGLDYARRLWRKRSAAQRALTGLLGLGLVGASAATFIYLSSHPSHAGLLSGREKFWRAALSIWGAHPWLGAGPGQYAFEYLRFTSIPPRFWAAYAHSVPLQVLAELGSLGFVLFVILCILIVRRLWRNWSAADGERRLWIGAVIAGMAAFAAQSLVDDFTAVPAVMLPLSIALASGWAGRRSRLRRWEGVPLLWLSLPALGFLAMVGWGGWAYQPLRGALEAAAAEDWGRAAQLSTISAQRAPRSAFYQTEAGLAAARWWGETGDRVALEAARRYFRASAALEPAFAVTHANLAVLAWYAGESEAALHEMEQAVALAPLEPVFHANLGWFYEETAQYDQARRAYQETLALAPRWAWHPFWGGNALRAQVLSGSGLSQERKPPEDSFLGQAWRAYLAGSWEEAERFLQMQAWNGGIDTRALLLNGLIAEGRGDLEAARQHYARLAEIMQEERLIVSYDLLWAYNISVHRREGFHFNLVPGFLRLEADLGQCEALERLLGWYESVGDVERTEEIRGLLENEFTIMR